MLIEKLKQARLEAGLSQRDIAKILNIKQPAYQAWESGKRNPKLENIQRLAEVLDVSVEYLNGESTSSYSLDNLLNSDTITYQGQNLSEDKMLELKSWLSEFINTIN